MKWSRAMLALIKLRIVQKWQAKARYSGLYEAWVLWVLPDTLEGKMLDLAETAKAQFRLSILASVSSNQATVWVTNDQTVLNVQESTTLD